MFPLISIVVPVYNSEKYLKRCVDSILGQSYKEIEVLLVDDGSIDASGGICDDYAQKDCRIRVIHKENGGLVSARKAGVEHALGQYIGFVDSDDWVDREMYERLVGTAVKHEAEIVCSGYYIHHNNKESVRYDGVLEGLYVEGYNYEKLVGKILGLKGEEDKRPLRSLCCKIFKKEIISRAIHKVEDSIRIGEDSLSFSFSVLQAKRVYVLREVYYHYCMNDGSMPHSGNPWYFREMNEFYVLFKNEISQYPAYAAILTKQLAYYMTDEILKGINWRFDFGVDISIPYYRLPVELLRGAEKIVVFGAGRVGTCYYKQLRQRDEYEVVAWIDSNYKQYEEKGLLVKSVECIAELSYDKILLGAMYRGIADSMKHTLYEAGVPEEKIVWSEPQSVIEME